MLESIIKYVLDQSQLLVACYSYFCQKKKCREFIVAPRPFGPPKSPFAASNKAAKHIWETHSARKDIKVRRSNRDAERGVGCYG